MTTENLDPEPEPEKASETEPDENPAQDESVQEDSAQQDSAQQDSAPEDSAQETGPARKARAWRVPAAALVLALAGAGILLFTEQQRESSASANRAVIDAPATTKVVGDVSNALAKVFSYEHGDVPTTEKAAGRLLEGKAAGQYRALFTQVKQQAPAQRLTLTTRVVRAGVTRLTGDTAHLLVFLDQVSTRNGKPAGGTAAAQLEVTARLHDGRWRITEIHAS